MRLPEYSLQVVSASVEERTFRDRTTGQSRSYLAVSISGFSLEHSSLFVLSCREALANRVKAIKVGEKIKVSLRSFDAKNGVVEGQVAEIL